MPERPPHEFSSRTREHNLECFQNEIFDLLIIGGGITGAATARDAASRGLKVALVEKKDFAYGTSSRSSKLIHGGLRYLENFEFGLVFEALAERSFLLKTVPHLVKPLKFFFPVYRGDKNGKTKLGLGLWFYDVLTLFRSPGFHKNLSKKALLGQVPTLKEEGLQGGFEYYDACMWDDGLTLETLRSAHFLGACIANYTEALKPIWEADQMMGFRVKDTEKSQEFDLKAKKIIICAGPWTDEIGLKCSAGWKNWLVPSKGVHLVFDLKRFPLEGAVVMAHPTDGRISFAIPRPDYGDGVVIVGTTDGKTDANPEQAQIAKEDVEYLLKLLGLYFPKLKISWPDIVSAYVGVRPLVSAEAQSLQKVSREHFISHGPGGCVFVAGGKYTTHRRMAQEIVDFAFPKGALRSQTDGPLFEKEKACFNEDSGTLSDLNFQLKHMIENSMVLHLEDFYFRRVPLFLSRVDSGLSLVSELSQIWAKALNKSPNETAQEIADLQETIKNRTRWR